ncbi:spore coat protein GerQ [Peribacillus sp. SI8-4]|uniref:spore coat protein GerQ n=1 Tax=Peribacillus sp. SI8-4 TaxID=3048009 RepID=UPI0025541B63|nr:spore coat protein GerQ [Peribacillus sp. SI8-4]
MTCGDSNYYPMNDHPGFYQASTMNGIGGCRETMPSGPSYAAPVVPMGTGQQLPAGAIEESFMENILRFNKGKIGTFYFTYQGSSKWNSMIYRGRVETAGRDHIIISDPASDKRYLLLMANLDWVEFEERINYPQAPISPNVQASMTTSD